MRHVPQKNPTPYTHKTPLFSLAADLFFLLEKATELGITHLWPCLTHTEVRQFNQKRFERLIIEASEQCDASDFQS